MDTKTLIIGASAAALGIAAKCGGDCLIIERGWSAASEFADAMRARPLDMTQPLSDYAGSIREELLTRKILGADGRIHPLAVGGVLAHRLLETGATVLMGAHPGELRRAGDSFEAEIFEVQGGWRTVRAERVIDTRVRPFMDCDKLFSVMLCGDETLAERDEYVSLTRGKFADEFVLSFIVPRSCDIPTAQKLAGRWLEKNSIGSAKVASIALEFGYRFAAPYRAEQGGVLYLPSDSYPDVLAAIEGGYNV